MNAALWVIQVLLAALFIFAGGMKLVVPLDKMGPMPFSDGFMHFIGVVELLGGIGLVVPAVTRVRPGLTPLAAAGLVIIMIGATVVTVRTVGASQAVFPLLIGLLAAFVAYGRWVKAPLTA